MNLTQDCLSRHTDFQCPIINNSVFFDAANKMMTTLIKEALSLSGCYGSMSDNSYLYKNNTAFRIEKIITFSSPAKRMLRIELLSKDAYIGKTRVELISEFSEIISVRYLDYLDKDTFHTLIADLFDLKDS